MAVGLLAAERRDDVEQQVFPASEVSETDKATSKSAAKLWHVYAGGTPQLYPGVSPRYVHLDGYTYRGSVYFLAPPTLLTHDPTAVLTRPLPNGQIEIVCSFQGVRPNF